jgi:hypothetical protein
VSASVCTGWGEFSEVYGSQDSGVEKKNKWNVFCSYDS